MKTRFMIIISSVALLMTARIGMAQSPSGRAVISANMTLFVAPSPTGSDGANDCTSSASPCQTIQRAVNVAATKDFGGHSITIHLADGTYNLTFPGFPVVVWLRWPLRGSWATVNRAPRARRAVETVS